MILFELFITFFIIGLFTIGGGYAMLPLIQSEVAAHGWMAENEIIDFIAVSESTPGAFAVNCATYVGSVKGGVLGALFATLGLVLPSYIIILIIARLFRRFRENRFVVGAMSGIAPAVIGLIAAAAFTVMLSVFFAGSFNTAAFASPAFWCSAGIFAIALLATFKKIHPIIVILFAGALGIALGYAGIF